MKPAAQRRQQFALGDIVHWSSQAGGNVKEKQGEVVLVVPPKTSVGKFGFGSYNFRDHESYIVAVKPAGRAKTRYYWPVVTLLKPTV